MCYKSTIFQTKIIHIILRTIAFQSVFLASNTEAITYYGVNIPPGSFCTNYQYYSNGDVYCFQTATCSSVRTCPRGQYIMGCNKILEGPLYCESCIGCGSGYYMVGCDGTGVTSSRQCYACQYGEYDNDASGYSASCMSCPIGKSTLNMLETSESACLLCEPGKYNYRNPSSCQLCPSGTYSNAIGATHCSSCPIGTYSNSLGALYPDTCLVCPTGTYSAKTAATSCEKCPAGTFSDTTGRSDCTLCPSGKYSNITGGVSLDSCITCSTELCQVGYYRSKCGGSDSGKCTACRNGITRPCLPGFFLVGCQDLSNGTCLLCNGTSSDPEIINDCLSCPRGKYSPATGLISISDCVDCKMGTFSSQEGALTSSSCIMCPAGTYSASTGATECTSCSPSLGQCPNTKGTHPRCSSTGTAFSCCDSNQYYRENVDTTCKTCTVDGIQQNGNWTRCDECTYGTVFHTGTPSIFTDIPNTRVYRFTSSGTIKLSWDMSAEILVVGGGGAGGSSNGGGGGAGTVIFDRITLPGSVTHTITVGSGGTVPPCTESCRAVNCISSCLQWYHITEKEGSPGWSSSIGNLYVAAGGAGGRSRMYPLPSSSVGSGGGGGGFDVPGGNVGVGSTFRGVSGVSTNANVRAFPGGSGSPEYSYGGFAQALMAGGGGGGAGSMGQNYVRGKGWDAFATYTPTDACSIELPNSLSNCGNCGNGGAGVQGVTTENGAFNFAEVFGAAYTGIAKSNFIAGGGAGGAHMSSTSEQTLLWPTTTCYGGAGGGGNGYRGFSRSDSDPGSPNTGSGGGGGARYSQGGVGGSGLVLIKVSFASCVCGPGTYKGADLCTPCPTGTYGTGYGLTHQSECVACAPGTYSDSVGESSNSTCTACVEGKYSYGKAEKCDPWTACPNGYFSAGSNASNPGVCSACIN
jgi:hypothetical protein